MVEFEEVEEKSADEINIEKAFAFKEEGNNYFKQKEYKKAIGKYCRVELFLKPIAPAEGDGGAADPGLAMAQGMKKTTVSKERVKELHELQAICFESEAVF